MGLIKNYTVEELSARLEEVSAEEMLADFLDESEQSEGVALELDVARDLSDTDSYKKYNTVEEFEEFLLSEDWGCIEWMNELKFDLALDAVYAYVEEGTELLEDEAFSIVENFTTAADGKIWFEINFTNLTEDFKEHFNID